MIDGTCHCGKIGWRCDELPETATVCNCTICRRYGAIWAYDWEGERIQVTGATGAYVWGDRDIGFHFCQGCGCVGWWCGLLPDAGGRRRIAVNLRLAEPGPVAAIPIRRFDGLGAFAALPRDGRCVSDFWA